ncbi:MAG: hypothetical protein WC867_06695 [Candidatus Pacearchaeota archaeon]|jgi:hypothetical protein
MLKDKLIPEIELKENVKCFLDYALPAIGCRNNFHKTTELENALLTGYVPNMGSLSCFFPNAFNWMLSYLKKNSEDIYNITPDEIRSYFWIGHSEVIDKGLDIYSSYPKEARNNCKVRFGRVDRICENQAYINFEDRILRPPVLIQNNLSLQLKDLVSIHAGQIAESIDEELYKRIMGKNYK